MCDDLLEIDELASRELRPLAPHVTSNGFPANRIVEFREKRKSEVPFHLPVSIDGVEGRHGAIRGIAGTWRRAKAAVEALAP